MALSPLSNQVYEKMVYASNFVCSSASQFLYHKEIGLIEKKDASVNWTLGGVGLGSRITNAVSAVFTIVFGVLQLVAAGAFYAIDWSSKPKTQPEVAETEAVAAKAEEPGATDAPKSDWQQCSVKCRQLAAAYFKELLPVLVLRIVSSGVVMPHYEGLEDSYKGPADAPRILNPTTKAAASAEGLATSAV